MTLAPDAKWDPSATDGLSEDWLDTLMALAQEHRVVSTPAGLAFTRADDIEAALQHPCVKVPLVEQYELMGMQGPLLDRASRVILALEGDAHARLRSVVSNAFTPRAVRRLTDAMQTYLNAALAELEGAVDVLNDLVGGYPAAVIGGVLGVPTADLPYLARLAEAITSSQFSLDPTRIAAYTKAAFACDDYLRDLVASKKSTPGEDILSGLIHAETASGRLTDDEVVSLSSSILNAGIDTTRHQSCLGLILLAERPDQWQALRRGRARVDDAVEEILRFRPAAPMVTRCATEDLVVNGIEIASGTYISLVVAAGNRDVSLNPVFPEDFDIWRSSIRHMTLGHGAHYCLGAALARLELAELLRAMLRRYKSISVVGDAPRRPVMGVYGVHALTMNLVPA